MNEAVERFDCLCDALQDSEFRVSRSPDEWPRLRRDKHPKNYDKLLDAVIPFLECFASAEPGVRAEMAHALTWISAGMLQHFVYYAPRLAVERNSPELIRWGWLAIASLREFADPRDLTFYFSDLLDAARRLNVDPRPLFAESVALSAPYTKKYLESVIANMLNHE